ncbi:MAG TPA: glucans biosynthesis glucosyltransferase MdoH [Geminicoccaceae bacterium]
MPATTTTLPRPTQPSRAAAGDARPEGGGRRLLFAGLVGAATLAVAAFAARVLAGDGFGPVDLALLLLLTGTLPWIAIGFCNALIGLAILVFARDPAGYVTPALARTDLQAPLASRTAVVVPVFDEEPGTVFRHLAATLASLEARPEAAAFEVFVLSDTRDPLIAAEEERRFALLRQGSAVPGRLHYRRRARNTGQKPGNLWDFLETHGHRFELMLVLDADSLMSGLAVVRLAKVMDQNPELGILQQLTVGLPATSPFARLFQVGMRHGMRTYTLGSAWWQGDCGPFWGHNGIVRIAPFRAHCRLPELPGSPPFGGRILSHDQVEAVLMRRAGREVRVLPLEDGSYEAHPPTVVEFVNRDRRWAQGNLQYLNLIPRLGDTHRTGRLQLVLAVLMYLNPPLSLAFVVLAFGREVARGLGLAGEGPPPWLPPGALGAVSPAEPWLLLALLLGLNFAPWVIGTLEVACRERRAAAYGGRLRVLATLPAEILFALLLSVLAPFAQAVFAVAMVGGRAVAWGPQHRAARALGWREALGSFWPQAAFGAALLAVCAALAPAALPWALMLGGGLLLSTPFAVATASPALGSWMARHRLAATPEELAPPPVVAAAGYGAPPPSPPNVAAAGADKG